MLKTLFKKLLSFPRGALLLSITTLGSYVTGLLRDKIFAYKFGASRELDIYNASFTIPDLLFNILVMSALSGAFVPLFRSLLTNGEKDRSDALASTMLQMACFTMIIVGIIAALTMPQLSSLVAPKWTGADREMLITLSRLMLLSPIIMGISNTLGGILVGYKSFLAYGLSPIFYNAGIIVGALTYKWFGMYSFVLGTLCGALLHALPRLIQAARTKFRYRWGVSFRDQHFRKLVRLAVPKMFGHPVEQLTFSSFNNIASGLHEGSLSTLNFARNFQSVPVSLFGIAFSVDSFPVLSEHAAKGDREGFVKEFRKTLRNILIFTIPAALGLYFLSDLPIRILLGGGKFSHENILVTASLLSLFALTVPTESIRHLLARSFYALKNTVIPVTFGILSLVIAVSYAYFNTKIIGLIAIPYGFFLGSFTEVVLLGLFLRRFIKHLEPATQTSPARAAMTSPQS